MSSLLIRYDPDLHGDEVGKLWFDLTTDQFSGSGFFWSNLSELPKIIEKIGCYPIEEKSVWRWGYEALEGNDVILLLSVAPVGKGGGLEMEVQIADLYDTAQRVAVKLKPDYVGLDRLRIELIALLENRAGEAVLEAQ